MVTVTNYHVRQRKDGKEFVSLTLQGDIEIVHSQETGKFYATAKRCSIASTFDEQMATNLIGTMMPGIIKRVEAEPYDFTIQDTGEVIKLAHSYEYAPETSIGLEVPVRRSQLA